MRSNAPPPFRAALPPKGPPIPLPVVEDPEELEEPDEPEELDEPEEEAAVTCNLVVLPAGAPVDVVQVRA